jgi:hypothetical protein
VFRERAFRSRTIFKTNCIHLFWLCRPSQKNAFERYCRNRITIRNVSSRTGANVHCASSSLMPLVVPLSTSVWHDLQERPRPD